MFTATISEMLPVNDSLRFGGARGASPQIGCYHAPVCRWKPQKWSVGLHDNIDEGDVPLLNGHKKECRCHASSVIPDRTTVGDEMRGRWRVGTTGDGPIEMSLAPRPRETSACPTGTVRVLQFVPSYE